MFVSREVTSKALARVRDRDGRRLRRPRILLLSPRPPGLGLARRGRRNHAAAPVVRRTRDRAAARGWLALHRQDRWTDYDADSSNDRLRHGRDAIGPFVAAFRERSAP